MISDKITLLQNIYTIHVAFYDFTQALKLPPEKHKKLYTCMNKIHPSLTTNQLFIKIINRLWLLNFKQITSKYTFNCSWNTFYGHKFRRKMATDEIEYVGSKAVQKPCDSNHAPNGQSIIFNRWHTSTKGQKFNHNFF